MSLCWQPVTLDCNGGPEVMGTYRDESAYVRIVGTQPCGTDDNGQPLGECPIYLRENFILLTDDEDPCLPDLPDPGIGELLMYRTTAKDAAGNEDCGQ